MNNVTTIPKAYDDAINVVQRYKARESDDHAWAVLQSIKDDLDRHRILAVADQPSKDKCPYKEWKWDGDKLVCLYGVGAVYIEADNSLVVEGGGPAEVVKYFLDVMCKSE